MVRGGNRERMEGILAQAGFSLSVLEKDRLWKYYNLIEKYNEECDLTRITRFEDFVVKHFVDSMIVSRFCELPPSLLDIGTGAGFPGIPLKIINPRITLVLAEQRSKRVEFLGRAVRELGLEGVEIYPHKVTDHSFFDVQGVITRALETADETLSRAAHFLPAGGRVLFMKGPGAGDDLDSLSDDNRRSYELERDHEYGLPGSVHRRRLLVFRKKDALRRRTYRIFIDQKENREVVITSESNKTYREFHRIVQGDGVKKTGGTLVSGKRIIRDLVRGGTATPRALIIHDGYAEEDDDLNAVMDALAAEKKLYILKKGLYNELDIFNTKGPLLAVDAPEIPAWDGTLAPGCNLLVPFQDPVNVGSVVRSAAAFGAGRIILLREAANPYHPRSVRASSGAVFGAPLFRGPSIAGLGDLPGGDIGHIIALDKKGAALEGFAFPERFLLLAGMEGPGIPAGVPFTTVAIPMEGSVESLNAAIAASIALYAWRSRR
jgi:16S rRNA (guanine527-N7)-methyltransferase